MEFLNPKYKDIFSYQDSGLNTFWVVKKTKEDRTC